MNKLRAYLNTPWPSPYRIFFSVGLLLGIASIGIWAFFALGTESLGFYPGFHHIFGVVSLFLGSFIVGFLLTALPRFTATNPANAILVYAISFVCAAEVLALIMNSPPAALFLCSFKFLMLQAFAVSKISGAKFKPPPSFLWIGAGLLSIVLGAAGKALAELEVIQNEAIAQFCHLAFTRGYILSLFMGVGALLIPILSGVRIAQPLQIQSGDATKKRTQEKLVHGILAALFFAGLFLEASYQSDLALEIGLFLQFFVVTTEVIVIWKMHRRPESTSRGRALSISSWAMVVGFALAVVFPQQRIHFMHIVYILGFLGGTLAIGAHVLVNHEAMDQSLLKRNWPLGTVTLVVILATALRILAPFWERYYLSLIGAASTLLILALSLWGGYFVSPLWKKGPT